MRENDVHIFVSKRDLDFEFSTSNLLPWLLLSSAVFSLTSFYGFPISSKSEARGRTDGRTDRPPREGPIISTNA